MAPGSRIGAAPPKVKTGEELSQKAQDTLLAESLAVLKAGARSLCKLKGHRPEIADAFVDRDKGLMLGTLKLADKGELLLLDADTAVQAVDGKPLLARAIISDVEALAKAAEPKGKLVILNGVWYDQALKKEVTAKPAPETGAKTKNSEAPAFTNSQSYAGKVVVIPVGQDDLILPARFEFMKRTLTRCNNDGAEAVIFELDTPGGLAWDTISLMMQDLQNLKARSFAFVNTRAISAAGPGRARQEQLRLHGDGPHRGAREGARCPHHRRDDRHGPRPEHQRAGDHSERGDRDAGFGAGDDADRWQAPAGQGDRQIDRGDQAA
jgi:hypothetical protein